MVEKLSHHENSQAVAEAAQRDRVFLLSEIFQGLTGYSPKEHSLIP